MIRDDRGSTIPLILGFVVLALLAVGASVALGAAFVQQRSVQALCDAAAQAAAAAGVELRSSTADGAVRLDEAAALAAVRDYLADDPDGARLEVRVALSADRTRVTLRCSQRRGLAFGAMFGLPSLEHTASSTARARVRD